MQLIWLLGLPVATGLAVILVADRRLAHWLSGLGSILTLLAGLGLALPVLAAGGAVYDMMGLLRMDGLSALLVVVIVTVGALTVLFSAGYMEKEIAAGAIEGRRLKWYYLCLHTFIFSMLLAVLVDNLGLMWVAIEATTLVSALLVGFTYQRASLEAAWKYIIICTVGIGFALLGTILTYAASQQALGETGATLQWVALVQAAPVLPVGLLKVAFIFILVGYGTKAGLAPMHTWLPDAHSQAPSPVSALLSGVLLNCALYGILQFRAILSASAAGHFSGNLLLLFGLLSMGLAVPFVLMQQDLKRMLAYSSVEHMGIMAVGFGLGGPLAVYGALLHLINHALTKAVLFLVAGNLAHRYHTHQMARIRGAVQAMPVTGTLLLVGTFAITGSPPFGLFVSEFSVLAAGFQQGRLLPAVLFLLFLTVIFAGFVFYAGKMALGQPLARMERGEALGWPAVLVIMPILAVLVLGVYMPPALDQALEVVVNVVRGDRCSHERTAEPDLRDAPGTG